ncbi:SGNH/GDSL hydrolase family protein [bacterium]|nr:SGNH/GDSL hydrolase family protein [bacterium]
MILAGNVQAAPRSRLATNLEAGKPQTVVAYGTSLTAACAWVSQLQDALNAKYPGLATVINSGASSMWSKWGVDNLETRVIQKKPDTVFIEFAINDAYLEYTTSVAQARANLVNMIERIQQANPNCEVILMTMNPSKYLDGQDRPKTADYYQMYREVAKERHLMLIDHYVRWKKILDADEALFMRYVPDGLHPGTEGCAKVITPGMLEALGISP